MVLVAQLEPGVRLRIPVACDFPPSLRDGILASVPEYDTEERAAATFDGIAPHYRRVSTPRGLYRIIQELRRRRRAVSRRKR
jgi:hypothetical protein